MSSQRWQGLWGFLGQGPGARFLATGTQLRFSCSKFPLRKCRVTDLKELRQELGMGVWVNPRKGRPRMDSRARILIPM